MDENTSYNTSIGMDLGKAAYTFQAHEGTNRKTTITPRKH